jgi:hypothetical protein
MAYASLIVNPFGSGRQVVANHHFDLALGPIALAVRKPIRDACARIENLEEKPVLVCHLLSRSFASKALLIGRPLLPGLSDYIDVLTFLSSIPTLITIDQFAKEG